MKVLKSLEDHNSESLKCMTGYEENVPNGIACPKCGEELLDSTPYVILTSIPPQLNIHCDKCNYRGFRIK